MKIKDFMTHDVVTVNKEMTVEEFIHVLENNAISGAPVTDSKNHILGVVSMTDIIRRSKYINNEIANLSERDQTEPSFDLIEIHKYHTTELFKSKVEDLMRISYSSVRPDDKLQKAIDIFLGSTAHRLLVIDDDYLVGVITIKDILQALMPANVNSA